MREKNRPTPATTETTALSGARLAGTEGDEMRGFFTPTPSSMSSMYPSFGAEAEPLGTETAALVTNLGRGTQVGHYELIRELGRGGMGHVFLARDTKLGRRVAIKFIRATSAQLAARFIAEARATAQCTHENIVVIHEVDAYKGLPYMVLEFLEGKTIKHLMRDRKVPPARAVEVITPVLRALVRAHANGIVHRDLKPDNIFLTDAGQVKVLDFGLVKVLDEHPARARSTSEMPTLSESGESRHTQDGVLVGTPPYMSPEQLGVGDGSTDPRTDIWAIGILLYRMLAGRHPLDNLSDKVLWDNARDLETPMPSLQTHAPELEPRLVRLVDGCLRKRPEHRWPSARALLDAMSELAPGHSPRLEFGQSPYPGLHPFGEADADRFFGRNREIARVVARLRQQPLLGLVGPSGVGKSSLVRAGIVPALKASGEDWDVKTIRPGRAPMLALARLIAEPDATANRTSELAAQLRQEPGLLGQAMRRQARAGRRPTLLFIDQFEELYTQGENSHERLSFTACLRGVADDITAPLRVIVSMRSDFLDRISEDRAFADELTSGIVLLSSPDREGLREALVEPLQMTNYAFEDPNIVEAMLGELEASPGALPLLQFAAARLWDLRDEERRLLTNMSYLDIGGVAGALVSHADDVLAGLGPALAPLVRGVFQRLVTPERTRAIVDIVELASLSEVPGQVERLLQRLVASRLVVIQNRGDSGGPAAEIVHESLITRWPTLSRWLDENEGDAAFLAQLNSAAKQWERRARPQGLLWRGEAATDARRWLHRTEQRLGPTESAFLDEVLSLDSRAARRKRIAVVAVMSALLAVAIGASLMMLKLQSAEKSATDAAERATLEADRAKAAQASANIEAARAREAEMEVKKQLDEIEAKELARRQALDEKEAANVEVAQSREELAEANKQLRRAAGDAKSAQKVAEAAAKEQKALAARIQTLLDREKARVAQLKADMAKISTTLK